MPPEGYIQKVREICSKYNVLMIADEIQTGFGRTGELFACDHENSKPDMVLLGKALGGGVYPISAIVTTKEITGPDVIKPGTHGSTFGGNPLASTVALKSLQIHIEDHLAERAKRLGTYFIEGLKKIVEKGSKVPVKEVRGKGLLIAIEFKADARHIVEELKDNGILAKYTHSTTIRFAPPLIINQEEINLALNVIEKVLII